MFSYESHAVLVVDDDPLNLSVMHTALNSVGYMTYAANSGYQALNMTPDIKPDLVLLDIVMPGIDGFEVCRRLKADPSTIDIPVIFITAHSNPDRMAEGFTLGAVDYLVKPVSMADLLIKVSTQIQIKSFLAEQQAQLEQVEICGNPLNLPTLSCDDKGMLHYNFQADTHYQGEFRKRLQQSAEIKPGPIKIKQNYKH